MRTEVTAGGQTYDLSKILHYMTTTGLQDVDPFERKEGLFLCHVTKLLKASEVDNSRTG